MPYFSSKKFLLGVTLFMGCTSLQAGRPFTEADLREMASLGSRALPEDAPSESSCRTARVEEALRHMRETSIAFNNAVQSITDQTDLLEFMTLANEAERVRAAYLQIALSDIVASQENFRRPSIQVFWQARP